MSWVTNTSWCGPLLKEDNTVSLQASDSQWKLPRIGRWCGSNHEGMHRTKTIFWKDEKLHQVQTSTVCSWHSSSSAGRDWQKFPSRQLVGSGCGFRRGSRVCMPGVTEEKQGTKTTVILWTLTKTEVVSIFIREAADWKWKFVFAYEITGWN